MAPQQNSKRVMVIGAHPDDAEFHAGGLMQLCAAAGHQIMILCLTDGSAGHHQLAADQLAKVRRQEAYAAAQLLNAEINIWDVADGTLQPVLELRQQLIGEIRRYAPDLIVTHRPADYHPDHRATAQLVQDACYLLQVPNIVPHIAPLTRLPAVLHAWDRFTYPRPFRADWIIDIKSVLDAVVDLLDCHASQVYEWLPHTQGTSAPTEGRRAWLRQWYGARPRHVAKRLATETAAVEVEYAEAFEVSEYGGAFDAGQFDLGTTVYPK